MEPPQKRLKLDQSPHVTDDDDEEQDELSMTPAQFDVTQDPMYELDKGRAKAATRLKSAFEDIFEKYGKDFTGSDDVINFYTDEIEVDNGHVQSLGYRKSSVPDDPVSSDEESRILNGKSNSHREKSRSKSLVPANHAQYQQMAQFGSPWNQPLDAGAYRLSSFAFSPFPYGPNAPFDFGRPFFGNGPIDPVWATPDLPVQTPNFLYGPLMGLGRSHTSSFGGQSNLFYKKRITAKTFRLRAASSKRGDGNARGKGNEEDEILLGRNKEANPRHPHLGSSENSLVIHGSRPNSGKSSRKADQQPPFRGLDVPRNKQKSNVDILKSEPAQARTITPLKPDVIIGLSQSAKRDTRHNQKAGISPDPSPSHRKKAQPQQNCPKSVPVSNQAPNVELRQLKQNERRIEVIIPIMKRLLSTEITQITEETDAMLSDTSRELDIEATRPDNSSHSSQSTDSHEDIESRPSSAGLITNAHGADEKNEAQTTKSPKPAPSPSDSPNIQLRRSTRKRKQTDFFGTTTEPDGTNSSEIVQKDISQESESPQAEVNHLASDDVAKSPDRMRLRSHDKNKIEQVTLDRQLSPIQSSGLREDEAARSSCAEETVNPVPARESASAKALMQTPSLSEKTWGSTNSVADESSDSTSVEEAISAEIMSQEQGGSHDDDEEVIDLDAMLACGHDSEELSMQLSTDSNTDENSDLTSTEEVVFEATTPQGLRRTRDYGEEVLCIDPVLLDKRRAENALMSPSSLSEKTRGAAGSSTDGNSDSATEEDIPEAIISQKLGDSHGNYEEPLCVERIPPPTDFHEEEAHPISTHLSDNTEPLQHDSILEDISSWVIPDTDETQTAAPEHDAQCSSPELPAICENTESNTCPVQASLSPTPEVSEMCQESKASDQSPFSNPDVVGIDNQLHPSSQNLERSPSLGAVESTSQNPFNSTQLPTSTLALRFLPPPTQTNTQNNESSTPPTEANIQNTAINRYPSPELGTPNGPEKVRGPITTPQTKPLTPNTPTKKRSAKSRLSPSKKRFPLTSLIREGSDDESDDDKPITASFSKSHPSSQKATTETPALPLLYTTPRRPKDRNKPPATDTRTSKSQQRKNRAVHSSPLSRSRRQSSPTKRSLRPCGADGYVCGRAFCLTCCV